MKLFRQVLVKNHTHTELPEVRFAYGKAAGVFGIVSNAILAAGKLVVGMLSGSATIVADAVNNISDAGSSVMTFVGFRLAAKPADKTHPFGHARYEYVTALIVALIVFAVGVVMAKSAVERIIRPVTDISINIYVYVVLAASIVVKCVQTYVNFDFGRAISSKALHATGVDSRNDVLNTTAVLIVSVIIKYTQWYVLDGIAALAVSLLIILSGVKLIKENVTPLLGVVPDKETVAQFESKILSYDGVLGMHDLLIHTYGKGYIFATVHLELDSKKSFVDCHELVDRIERDFLRDMNVRLSIHMDPTEVDDALTAELRTECQRILTLLDGRLSIHDFRIATGEEGRRILFDVIVPFDVRISKEDMIEALRGGIRDEDVKFVINIDNEYY